MNSISGKTILVYDRGLYVPLAQKLGESAKKVLYFMPDSSPYPISNKANIGKGLPEIERIPCDSFWEYLDKADMVFFPDCYDGKLQTWLQGKGYRIFGGLGSEKVEMDKAFFYEHLEDIGLPVPYTYIAEGLDDLEEHLSQATGDKWLKTSFNRGDFETKHFRDMDQIRPWMDDLRCRLGQKRSKEIEILVQNPIKSVCEVGGDRFCVNGEFTDNGLVGYEIKDKGYVCKVFKTMPKAIDSVDQKMAPLFKELGFQGHWSTEIRLTKDGRPYFIDATPRAPSPPSELMCEIYENYADAVWQISGGDVPELKPRAMFGAEIIITSDWHVNHEMCVKFPKELSPNIKLKNQTKDGDSYYVIPNENAGFFGAVVAWGGSIDEVTAKCLEVIKEIKCDDLDVDESIFEEAATQIEGGERFGITFK